MGTNTASSLYYSLKAYNDTLTVANSLLITDALRNCLYNVGHAVVWGTTASSTNFKAQYVQLVSVRSSVASLPSKLAIDAYTVGFPATFGSELHATGSVVDIVYVLLDKEINPYYWSNASRDLNSDSVDLAVFEVADAQAAKTEVQVSGLSKGVDITLPLVDAWPYLECVYWDEDSLDWSASGCKTVFNKTNPLSVNCVCDHFTTFSVRSLVAPARPTGPGAKPVVPGRLVDRELASFPVCSNLKILINFK